MRVMDDELTKHLSFLRPREGGIGPHADPNPLRANGHTDTLDQLLALFIPIMISGWVPTYRFYQYNNLLKK